MKRIISIVTTILIILGGSTMGAKADAIRNAVYGKDIRETMAQLCEDEENLRVDYDAQVINAGNSNAEIVEARGNFPKLKNRLDNSDLQLAESKSNINTQIQAVASGSPKGVYATVSDLQTAYPTGTTGTYVVTADGKWYYWNGSAWTAGGVYQSTGIADGSVTPEKTSFLTPSKNLFNVANITSGYYVERTTGILCANSNYSTSDFIQIEPNTQYVFTNMSDTGDQVAFYDSNKNYIGGTLLYDNLIVSSPLNAKYLRFAFRNTESKISLAKDSACYDQYGHTLKDILINYDNLSDNLKNTLVTYDDLPNNLKNIPTYDLLRYVECPNSDNTYPLNCYFFGRWFKKTIDSNEFMVSINAGSQIFAKVQNTTTVKINTINLCTLANEPAYFSASIDGGEYTRYAAINGTTTIASGLDLGTHYIRIIVSAVSLDEDLWTSNLGFIFKSMEVDNGGVCKPVRPKNRIGLFLGDSITAGVNVLSASYVGFCSEKSYASICSQKINVAPIIVGFPATGITKSGSGGVPGLITFMDYVANGIPENTDYPDFIVVNVGTNDGGQTSESFKVDYNIALKNLKLKYPAIPIFCIIPFNGNHKDDISTVVQNNNCILVDTTGWNPATTDGLHPSEAGDITISEKLANFIKSILGSSYFM